MHIDAEAFGEQALVVGVAHLVEDGGAHRDLGADVGRGAVSRVRPGQHGHFADCGQVCRHFQYGPEFGREIIHILKNLAGLYALQYGRLDRVQFFIRVCGII